MTKITIGARAVLLLGCLVLAGCWQANGSLYNGARPVTPFHPGTVTETEGKQPAQHFALTLNPDRSYRLIGTDRNNEDRGEGFELRFYDLRGIPNDLYVYEAVSLSHCARPSGCDAIKPDAPRYYGLVRVTPQGAEEIRPDCKTDAAATAPFGIAQKDGACTFPNRSALKTSLTLLAQGDKKAAFFYRLK